MYSSYIKSIFVTVAFAASLSISAEEKYLPTIEALFSLKTISSVGISPDASYIVYSKQELDFEEDQYLTQLWVYNIKGE